MVRAQRQRGRARALALVGALALAMRRVDAAWPVRKNIATHGIEVFNEDTTDASSNIVIDTNAGTFMVGDKGVVTGDLFPAGDVPNTDPGVSERIQDVEDDLDTYRTSYNGINLDTVKSMGDDCADKLTVLKGRLDGLKEAVKTRRYTPFACEAPGAKGLRRIVDPDDSNYYIWDCVCQDDYTGENCTTAPCTVDLTSLNSVEDLHQHNCSATLPVDSGYDSTCTYECGDGYTPTEADLTCTTASSELFNADTHQCQTCDAAGLTDYRGINCAKGPCTVLVTTIESAIGTDGSHNCTATLPVNDQGNEYLSVCAAQCADDFVTGNGVIDCRADSTAGTQVGGSVSCTACDSVAGGGKIDFTGPECTLHPCSIDVTGVTNRDPSRTTCGSTMKIGRGTDSVCQVKCADDYVTTNADVDCGSLTASTTVQVAATVSTTCTHCDNVAGKLNYRGEECANYPCAVDIDHLDGIVDTIGGSHNCDATYVANSAGVCSLTCPDDYVVADGDISCSGQTPSSDPADYFNDLVGSTASCTTCDDVTGGGKIDFTGPGCTLHPCSIDLSGVSNYSPTRTTCGSTMKIGRGTDSVCQVKCADDYVTTNADVDCRTLIASTTVQVAATVSTTCTACDNVAGKTDFTGEECTLHPCSIDFSGVTNRDPSRTTCGSTMKIGRDTDSVCQVKCADDYVTTNADVDCRTLTASTTAQVAATVSTTCTACDDVAGKTDFTGEECTLHPCSIDFSGVANHDPSRTTCGSTMKIGRDTDSVCQVKCADDYVTTNADVDCRTLTASTTAQVAATVSTTCTHCDNVAGKLNYRGEECTVAPCQIDTNVLDNIANIASHDCTITLPVGQATDSVCTITCQQGFQAQNGVISCEAASTAGTTISVNNARCVSTD